MTDWIVINMNNGRFACLRCGATYAARYPAPITIFFGISDAFGATHEDCTVRPEGLHCVYCWKTGHEPVACRWRPNEQSP